jgi:hypothetical protein
MKEKIPQFRPLPLGIRGVRQHGTDYARFYGMVRTKNDKRKVLSFSVKINQKLSNKTKGKLIASVCGHFKDRRVPIHKKGQMFPSFKTLLYKTNWIKVKRIENYEAGVEYDA